MPVVLVPISTASVVGTYGSQTDMENVFGTQNIAQYSDINNTQGGGADETRIQAASDYADSQIDAYFTDGPFNVPLAFTSTSATVMTKNWYAVIAGVWMYSNRGTRDVKADDVGAKYAKMLTGVYRQMGLCKSGAIRLAAQRRWPSPSAPTAACV